MKKDLPDFDKTTSTMDQDASQRLKQKLLLINQPLTQSEIIYLKQRMKQTADAHKRLRPSLENHIK
ncbi:MAG: hypothetical protein V4629_02325 [Pseudomonadota bacterium]